MSNAWSNRGAITTTFTPPSSCFTTTFDTLVTEMSFFHVAHWGGYGKGYGGSCYPSSASTVTFGGTATSDTAFNNYYYSPALICPSGWTTARSLSLTPSDGFTTTSGVSAYLCCPSGLVWSYAVYAPYHQCAVTTIPGNVLYNVTLTDLSLSYASLSIPGTTSAVVSCDGVPILYDQADFASFQRALSTTTSLAQSQTPSTSKSSSSIPAPTGTSPGNSNSTGSKGLSSGAKAGISIAAVLAAFAIFLFLFLFIRRHRKQQATQNVQHRETSAAEVDGKGVFISEFPTSANKHELPSPYHRNQELESPDYRAKYSMDHELHAAVPGELGAYDPPDCIASTSAENPQAPVTRKAVPTQAENKDDPELERMKAEIEALRVEKEQRLQDLERRERELSRAIVEKSETNMRGNLG